jgi:hypothetical protein
MNDIEGPCPSPVERPRWASKAPAGRRRKSTESRPRVEALEGRPLLSGNMNGLPIPQGIADLSRIADGPNGSLVDPGLLASGVAVQANQGLAFSGQVASFADLDPNGTASDFSAKIDWGDGTTSAGTVAADGRGGFTVEGEHTYGQTGAYEVTVAIQDVGGSAALAKSRAVVVDASGGRVGVPGGTSSGGPGSSRGSAGGISSHPGSPGHPVLDRLRNRLTTILHRWLSPPWGGRPALRYRPLVASLLRTTMRRLENVERLESRPAAPRHGHVNQPTAVTSSLPSVTAAHDAALRHLLAAGIHERSRRFGPDVDKLWK